MESTTTIVIWSLIIGASFAWMFYITNKDNGKIKEMEAEAEREWAQRKANVAKVHPNLSEEEISRKAALFPSLYGESEIEKYYSRKGSLDTTNPYEDSYNEHRSNKKEGDFLTSAVVAGVTDSAILGSVIGGDITGAVIGDVFFGDEDSDDPLWD